MDRIPTPPPLVSTAAAARVLGVTGERVRQLRAAGRLAAARIDGGTWIYRLDDVERLAEKRAAAQAERAAARAVRPPIAATSGAA